MITLRINNSFSQITGVNVKQFNELRNLLSYNIDSSAAYFSGRSFNTKRYLIDKKGVFSSGLCHRVKEWLTNSGAAYSIVDRRSTPSSLPVFTNQHMPKFGFSARGDQWRTIRAATSTTRGTIVMPTGTGKSACIAILAGLMRHKTLIIVPNLGLKLQLQENFNKWFPNDVCKNIVIENIDSPKLKTMTDFDMLIIDEAHHVAAKTYRDLNKTAWKNIYYRYFFTATPFRSNDEEQLLMESISGEVIYRLEYKEAVLEKMIVPVEAYYFDLPKIPVKGRTWATVYNELVVNRKDRNELIAKFLETLREAKKHVLCLVKEIAHGEAISKLANNGSFANGQSDDCDVLISWFNAGQLRRLIATTGVCGEGIDTKPAEYVVIAGLGKSKNAFMQMAGRGVRVWKDKDSCKVILFRDPSHKWSLNHFREQCRILKEQYGVTPQKLTLEK